MAHVGITYDLKTDWKRNPDDPEDISAEFDKPETLERVVSAFEKSGHKVKRIGNIDNLLKQVDHLDVDIVFNICEGKSGRNRESQVPMILEMKGVPYVGSDALTLGVTLDKIFAKKMFISDGIPTPRYFSASSSDDLEKLNTIGYPLIVKTHQEGSSKGITKYSRVENLTALKRQVDLINKTYRQPALVEEFIKGSECTVAVLGNENPKAMPIAQVSIDNNVKLGDQIYLHELIASNTLQYVCPARFSHALTQQIQELAVRAYQCVECRDFGRVDFRIDENDKPYVLEINPLPSLDATDVFNIFPYVMDSSYEEIVNRVLNFGLKRYNLARVDDIIMQNQD